MTAFFCFVRFLVQVANFVFPHKVIAKRLWLKRISESTNNPENSYNPARIYLFNDVNDVIPVSFLSILNRFHTLFLKFPILILHKQMPEGKFNISVKPFVLPYSFSSENECRVKHIPCLGSKPYCVESLKRISRCFKAWS